MKTISAAMQSYLTSDVVSLATCWLITRTDGVVMGFTDWTDNIVYNSITYEAAAGYTRSAISGKSDLSVSNLEVQGILASNAILESDIEAGAYDFAQVSIFMLNPHDLTAGIIKLRSGFMGQLQTEDGQYTAELRGLTQLLDQTMLRLYAIECDADFCDSRCGLSAANFTYTGTVISIGTPQRIFAASLGGSPPTPSFSDGGVTQQSGAQPYIGVFYNGSETVTSVQNALIAGAGN
ncbi:MAG: DUF2163 domain-containing protein, partial [Patescibacteria group bacterium]|nr:DUF2163 domain-containing protein [Patescibacteria group bacterium]